MPRIRMFIAIELPSDIQQRIATVVLDAASVGSRVKWVETNNLHLTLKFLGGVEETMLSDVQNALTDVATQSQQFTMVMRGVGGFPNFKRPRVLWVGVDAPQALLDLQSRIENAFQQLGFERERRAFHPHITIGRVKAPQGISAVVQRLSKYENEMFGELHVQQITLMRSDLTPQGPIYTPLSHHQLSGHCN